MKKVSYYIAALIIAAVAVISFWVYQKYLKPSPTAFLYFPVERGDLQESVKVRGEAVAQNDFSLEFPFSGTVAKVFVHEGDLVQAGQQLMSLDTKDLSIQAAGLTAVVAQRKADLAKLLAGATPEEISVAAAQLSSAQIAAAEAQKGLIDAIKAAYTQSDDAVHAKTDQLFSNPRSMTPDLVLPVDQALKYSINSSRLSMEPLLNVWGTSLPTLAAAADLSSYESAAKNDLTSVASYLNQLASATNDVSASVLFSQATIDGYRLAVSTARTNVDGAITALASAEEKYTLAQANVTLYGNQLALKQAAARTEDVTIAESAVQEAESQLAAIQDNIDRSTLRAPAAGKVSALSVSVGEIFHPTQPAVSLVTNDYKIQADVSELEIAQVEASEGVTDSVRIALDAFPGMSFTGTVTSIDPQEIVKTEDKYYRVNIAFDPQGKEVRSGMSADVTILSTKKTGVLKVSELAVYKDGATSYVKLVPEGMQSVTSESQLERTPVETGITDGDSVEIVSGAQEGRLAAVSAE
ncbi:HlyD family efflux transporter periplasmic adaptor subunit [Patescibacteria group bacterium]|nr:HlyD family efflux transporter periplasmic adaptor subunit [Patescibacteria group bacterium]